MGLERQYHRTAIKRRLKAHSKKIARLKADIDKIIEVLLENNGEELAKNFSVLWHLMSEVEDFLVKLSESL